MKKTSAPALFWTLWMLPALFAAGDVFYASPTGTGNGSSWADATSLTNAYAAATAAGGGEVWMQAGTYVLEEAIPLVGGIAVRGGFAGTETAANQADPTANQTIVSGDVAGNNKWAAVGISGQPNVAMWQDGVFTEPNPDGRADYWHGYIAACLSDETTNAFVLAEADVLSGAAFSGITFTGFKSFVFQLQSTVAGGTISFTDCKFLGVSIGGQTKGTPTSGATIFTWGAAILSENVAVQASSCEFVGITRPIYLSFTVAHTAGAVNAITNCSFRANRYHCIYYGIDSVAKLSGHKLSVDRCSFDRNYSEDYSYGGVVLKVGLPESSGATLAFRDCSFTRSIMRNGSMGLFYTDGKSTAYNFERCRFSGNVVRDSKSNRISTMVNANLGNVLIRDCHFTGNIATNTATGSGNIVSASSVFHYSGTCDIVNCTFEGNRMVGLSESSACMSIIYLTTYAHLALANCTFADNVFEGPHKMAADILFNTAGSATVGIVNTIFDSAGCTSLKGLSSSITLKGMAVCNSLIPDYGQSLTEPFSVFSDRGNIATEGAPLAARGRSNGDLLYGRGVSARAPLRWNGIEVKIASRRIYAYQPIISKSKPWNRLGEDSQVASVSTATIPDLFGRPRNAGRISYGPLQADPLPTQLSVW